MLFADDILNMYEKFCDSLGFNWDLQVYQDGENTSKKSCKYAKVEITGERVYSYFQNEVGVHKVQRVPITETKGRVHSSTCQVVVMKDTADDYLQEEIKERDLKYEYMRAGGAGGQHVNKTESACRITHIPTGISVHISESREQHQNKLKALTILKEKLNSIHKNEHNSKIQAERKGQMGSGALFEKIRTYNFPDSRVTDHRLGETFYGINKIFEGKMLETIIEKLQKKEHDKKIASRLEKMIGNDNI